MKKKKVICIGEALIDRIRNKSNQGFTDFLGGAPANVACALRKLKIDSTFIEVWVVTIMEKNLLRNLMNWMLI